MRPKTAGTLNIVVALFFAAAILLSSYLLAGTGYQQTTIFWLIALWLIPFSMLSGGGCRGSSNCAN